MRTKMNPSLQELTTHAENDENPLIIISVRQCIVGGTAWEYKPPLHVEEETFHLRPEGSPMK